MRARFVRGEGEMCARFVREGEMRVRFVLGGEGWDGGGGSHPRVRSLADRIAPLEVTRARLLPHEPPCVQ